MDAVAATPRLSAFVVTKNEEHNLERCLASLDFCDEIVIVDAESLDRTVEIARRFTQRVYVEPWRGYAAQKQRALDLCLGKWVLSIDADEAVLPDLARAIGHAVTAADSQHAGFRIRRRVFYFGSWIRFGSFGNDWVPRLALRERARFSTDLVHEELLVDGVIGRLPGVLGHWSYRNLAHHRAKIEQLSALWAEQEWARGRRASRVDLLYRPPARGLRMLILECGFLNGWRGFVIAWMGMKYVRRKYEQLRGRVDDDVR